MLISSSAVFCFYRIVLISGRRSFYSVFSVLPYRDCSQAGYVSYSMPNLQTSSSLCSLFLLSFLIPLCLWACSPPTGVHSAKRCSWWIHSHRWGQLHELTLGWMVLGGLKLQCVTFKWMNVPFRPNPRQMDLRKADSSQSMPSKSLTAYEFDKSTVGLGRSCACVWANVNFPKVLHLNAICCHVLIKTVNMVDLLCFLAPSLTWKKGKNTTKTVDEKYLSFNITMVCVVSSHPWCKQSLHAWRSVIHRVLLAARVHQKLRTVALMLEHDACNAFSPWAFLGVQLFNFRENHFCLSQRLLASPFLAFSKWVTISGTNAFSFLEPQLLPIFFLFVLFSS